MAEPYKIVVGLEVHVQLLTKTKLFCGCRNQFGLPPNSATCPVCLGMPGSLPVMNRTAFDLALRAALALNCKIRMPPEHRHTKWDRKNYYYPDLPKNYQISQYDEPFSHDGHLEINVHPDPKKGYEAKQIRIIRVHLEEDAGKNVHDETGRGGDTRVDLNRTGTPLLEIVSQPDMNSPEEAMAYLDEVRLMLRELGVSDCEMQEGSLRCDANVNVHIRLPSGRFVPTPLVEIKNLNSFRAVGRAIKYESERQYTEFLSDPSKQEVGTAIHTAAGWENPMFPGVVFESRWASLLKTTAGWDDAKGRTEVQRHKEEAADYRYFPEPDLVPVVVSADQVEAVKATMGELPAAQRTRLASQYGLTRYDADVLAAKGRAMVGYFEAVAAALGDGKTAANRISDLVYPALTDRREEIGAFPMPAVAFADFVKKTASVPKQDRSDVFKHVLETGVTVEQAMAAKGVATSFDEGKLRSAVQAAMAANPKAVADFKAGKDAAKMALVGAVMKANKGAPNDVVRRLVDEELGKG